MLIKTFLCTLLFTSTACAAEAEKLDPVLGLPLGGKPPALMRCTIDEIGSTRLKKMCWIDNPHVFKGGRSGTIILPNPGSRPKWAVYSSFGISIDPKGILEAIEIRSSGDALEIERSIEARFGLPTERFNSPKMRSATWDKSNIHIRVLCSPETKCHVDFRTRKLEDQRLADVAARKQIDAARPAMP